MWEFNGQRRPPFAETPAIGQESVWDYPRPPVARECRRRVTVRNGAREIANSDGAYRVLETASPPTYYVPPQAVDASALTVIDRTSYCEWKGAARYFALADDPQGRPVAWTYPRPNAAFSCIRDYVAFYPGRLECFVDGERVRPQPGGFYGGWITDDVVGPFKGEPGAEHW